jgi:chemotaxis protein methyltransferase CheR
MTISDDDFELVRKLVHQHSGIAIDDGKEYLVDARLELLARREDFRSVGELVAAVRNGSARLSESAVCAMTTNETSFFRDLHPFDVLRSTVIPTVLEANGGRQLAIWSAATATGQEAYSIALVIREHFPDISNVRILATDLCPEVLDRAKTGRYSQHEVNRGLPAPLLVKHFDKDGQEWQLKPSIRRMVTFRVVNLSRPLAAIPPMDVIFLRNVLIYFDPPTRVAVLSAVSRVLRPGGYLFLGGQETTYGVDQAYQRVQAGPAVCYRFSGQHGRYGGDDRD